ncbi:MAG: excinuclease ABC subunit UvrC [Candidatus Thermoplasmatota archaeon]
MFDIDLIPKDSGCYIFKDKNNKVLYVGKAKNLRKRVSNYNRVNNLDLKTKYLINNIDKIDYIVTDNEIEAFILENTLIKKYQPKYNIDLKDAKNYAYIKIPDESYPRILIARDRKGKGKYYGPFVSAKERDYILYFLRRTFKVRTCNKIPKKVCLRYHINLCNAPCIDNVTLEEYTETIKKIKWVLSGKSKDLIKQLNKEMQVYMENLQYEQALKIKNEIYALEKINEHQNMKREKKHNEDIINFKIKDNRVYLLLFHVYKGTLADKNEFIFDYNNDFLDEFIIQYYSENQIPKEIIISRKMSDSIVSFLQTKKGGNVIINNPVKGEKKQLLDLVEKNIDITFLKGFNKNNSLKLKLNLLKTPKIIECFDISHLSGTSIVGSMVQFVEGKPFKNNYRRYRIRSIKKIDDFKAIAEVVRRRYQRLINEKTIFPDLIIIDGGKGQLNFAEKELKKLNLDIPIIAIAKKFEEIYAPNHIKPLKLDKKDVALQYIQEIRDEAHRFAINYNKLLRRKELIP